jgi:Flp pilus assembly protein TadD
MNPSRQIKSWLGIAALAIPFSIFSLLSGDAIAQSSTVASKQSSLSAAKTQVAHGDLPSAESTLWTILGTDPNNTEALLILGEVRSRQRRFPEAEALFRRVLQVDPKSAAGHRNLAQTLAVENKPGDALAEFRSAAELAPRDVNIRVELARLYVGSGQFGQAVSTLQSIPPAQFPADAIPVKAAAFLATGRKAEAIHLIEPARSSTNAELDLAEVYLRNNLPDEALRCLEIASAAVKQSTRLDYLRGRALTEKNQTEAAFAALQHSLAQDPKSPDTLVALAEIYSTQNKHADAVAALEKARALNPDSLPLLRHLVVEATKAGDSKAAIEAASALSDKSPDNPDDLYLAAAAMLQQNVQGAASVLEKYVALRPDNARAWMGLGIAYVQQEHWDQARKPLERAIQLDPTLAEAEYELGLVAKSQAKADEAIQHLQRALQLQPKHVGALRTLGNLYLQSGELERAKEALEQAEAFDANNVQTEYDLGLVCNKLGQTSLARQHMEQYRKLKAAASGDTHN